MNRRGFIAGLLGMLAAPWAAKAAVEQLPLVVGRKGGVAPGLEMDWVTPQQLLDMLQEREERARSEAAYRMEDVLWGNG